MKGNKLENNNKNHLFVLTQLKIITINIVKLVESTACPNNHKG